MKPMSLRLSFLQHQEAVTSSDASMWLKAIEDKLQAHRDNETWTVVSRNRDKQTIDTKWVFKVHRKTTGDIERFKARLCARGFKQKEGMDYTETFSPVVLYDSLRVLLAIIAEKDLELAQFDVKTTFLYGELKEEVFMEIPEGLVIDDAKEKVCKLNKSLYGLKQASRCWN